ncbi:MAG: pyrroline-5-carboxylate reductase [Pseudomonadota bacterium]
MKPSELQQLVFIGAGNMARSLIGGLIDNGYDPSAISATDVSTEALAAAQADFGVVTQTDTAAAVRDADVVVLAIKPQQMSEVCASLCDSVQVQQPLIVSVAAGIRTIDMNRWLGGDTALVRCMPNTPALLRCGASGLYANDSVSAAQRDIAENILTAVSRVVWVDNEDQIDAVTAVSGSGPAYFFLLIEAMQNAGEALGLDAEQARELVLQTAFGAATMAREGSTDAATLRRNVTSKGGTTHAAIETFENGELRSLVGNAMRAAADRSAELGKQLGEQ